MNHLPITTAVVLITGDIDRLAEQATQLLFDLRYYAERNPATARIVVVIDGTHWRNHFSDDELAIEGALIRTVTGASELPGSLLNSVLDEVTTDWLCVLGIGSEISTWYSNLPRWHDLLPSVTTPMIAGYRSHSEGRSAANESYLVHQDDAFSSDYPHAWLQMLDLVPLCNSMLRVDFLREMGGFSDAPALQRMWWWEFCLRASRQHSIGAIDMQPVPGPRWHHYAFHTEQAATIEQNLAGLMHLDAETRRVSSARQDELAALAGGVSRTATALAARSPSWRALPDEMQRRLHALLLARGRPLNVIVIGGVNEPAHNQLCFFNFFARMCHWGALNWRAILDERVTGDDIAQADLVIFSRVRSDNGVALMAACKERNIRTLYMQDDNWFWLGREWDEYASIFTPGAPPYENFIKLVRAADVTLTYRAPLAEDLAPYAKRVVTLPTNVDCRAFDRPRGNVALSAPARPLKIGYVGSLRKNMLAFDALVRVVQARQDVDIFVMSNALPEELAGLPAERVHFEPYQFNYAAYAATVVAAAPDVLVAPVGRTRFEASKCPNKYLEITACGAAGVYSRNEPYTTYVQDGETGLFADDDVVSWVAAITRLLDDASLRRAIVQRAQAHVAAEFDTAAVLPQFVGLLLDAVDAKSLP